MLNVLHSDIARILEGMTADLPAAEAHGCLCGALCADDGYSLSRWLADLAPDATGDSADPALVQLFRDTALVLQGDDMEFVPLLPEEDAPLIHRTQALAEWTQGFLYGLAAGEIGRRADLPANVTEILRDFAEIGRATLSDADAAADEQGEEGDETAFAELYEFVRVGAQLVYDELLPLRRAEMNLPFAP